MKSDHPRQARLIGPSRHAAREAWLSAREVRRRCAELVTKAAADLKAAKEAHAHALEVEEDNAGEWESLLLNEVPKLEDTAPPEGDFDPLRT